ncbi:AAA family ATPase [Pseudaquidulcibacter saccharophilus]|uniref:AAA family ATPase n=1 Tax=Pseudaquidulcibacter saccharophilus TaxID=2831900 RepID=UPI001EFF56AA|nr:AAA family ATPase [Pseudaquidulcibacter saccharophilus]
MTFDSITLDGLQKLPLFTLSGEAQKLPIKIEGFLHSEYCELPPIQWVYGNFLQRGTVSALIGAAGQGKSMIALGMGICLAFGESFYFDTVKQKSRVWLFNGEDSKDNLQRRIHAFCKKNELNPKELEGQFFINSGLENSLKCAWSESGSKFVENETEIQSIISQLKEMKIDVAIFDPFISFHRVNENDNNAIDIVVKLFAKIAVEANCAVLLVHHSGKSRGEAVGFEGARGASSFIGAVRAAWVLNNLSNADGERFGIKYEEIAQYVTITEVKSNFAAKSSKKKYFKLESEFFENANQEIESMGVAVAQNFEAIDVFQEIMSDEQWVELIPILKNGKWRYNSQAKDWIGIPISELLKKELGNRDDKHFIRKLIDEAINSEILEKYNEIDHRRHEKEFVRVKNAPSIV